MALSYGVVAPAVISWASRVARSLRPVGDPASWSAIDGGTVTSADLSISGVKFGSTDCTE